jgi:hypothetical protein
LLEKRLCKDTLGRLVVFMYTCRTETAVYKYHQFTGMRRKSVFIVFVLILSLESIGQARQEAKFGKVKPIDFQPTVYSVDSGAHAVIVADIGSTQVIGNSKGWFSLESKHYRRAHILHKNGYDIADITLYLYTDEDDEEELPRLKAVTYNLQDGEVIETPLDQKSGIFKEKLSKKLVALKFTFPNVKEGSIIEFEYTKTSDFLLSMDPWEFQGEYPRLWSEYTFYVPAFFNYVFLYQGYREFDIKDVKRRRQMFNVRDTRGTVASSHSDFSDNVNEYKWVMKNVPPLKQESYTSTLKNHISRIEFHLTEQKEPLASHKYLESWEKLAKDLLKAEYFGEALERGNGWLSDLISPAISTATTEEDQARRVYQYVRDHYTCTNHNSRGMNQNLRTIARSRNGNVAEINLLLAAMLKHLNIHADPVLLSTRSNGYTYSSYPLPERFNYVICRTIIGGKAYYLDASQPQLGFGKLGYECYNGHARVIDDAASPVEFIADSVVEQKTTSIVIVSNENGKLSGSMRQVPGYFESLTLRRRVKDDGKQEILNSIKRIYNNSNIDISEPTIDSLDNYELPVEIRYLFTMAKPNEDIYYFNPMFNEGSKENPFKSSQRFYPVEMPYALDEIFLLRLDVPPGYIVDELPKQIMVKLNPEGDGLFEYRISESNGIISLRSRLRISRTFFQADEYDMLREFFNLVVKKHSEQIVFKKKK